MCASVQTGPVLFFWPGVVIWTGELTASVGHTSVLFVSVHHVPAKLLSEGA